MFWIKFKTLLKSHSTSCKNLTINTIWEHIEMFFLIHLRWWILSLSLKNNIIYVILNVYLFVTFSKITSNISKHNISNIRTLVISSLRITYITITWAFPHIQVIYPFKILIRVHLVHITYDKHWYISSTYPLYLSLWE